MTSAQPRTSSRLTLLRSSPLADTTSANMDSDSSVDSESSESSTGDSPTTPTSAVTLAGNPTFRSKHSQSSPKPSTSGSSTIPTSSSKSDSSEDEGPSSSSDSSTPRQPKQQPECDSSYPEPVFSSIPTRRVQSSNAVFRGTGMGTTSPSSYACTTAPSSPSPTSATFPRRIPSFPVSRPIRPFDSISNAMGTAPKRVSPPLSRSESHASQPDPRPHPHLHMPNLAGVGDEKLHMKPKGLSVQTAGLETGKPKGRSNVLLAPPKNSRFQHGFLILDMTQDEFKTRAW